MRDLQSFQNMIIFSNTSAEIKTKSTDVLLKMITILKELRIATVSLKWTDINDGYKRAIPWSWDAQLSNLISSSSYQTIQTEKKMMRMATLLSSPFEQWHFTSQTGHQSQTFWAQAGRYYNKMWEKHNVVYGWPQSVMISSIFMNVTRKDTRS